MVDFYHIVLKKICCRDDSFDGVSGEYNLELSTSSQLSQLCHVEGDSSNPFASCTPISTFIPTN
jgi:hypothetical protein